MAISDELRKLVDPNNECCCEHCLSNKCKEWASKTGNTITTYEYSKNCTVALIGFSFYDCFVGTGREGRRWKYEYEFEADTEPEAIFKACEYILK